MKGMVILIEKKQKYIFLKNPITKNQNQMSFSTSTNIQFTVWEQFLQLKACKSVEIDAIGIFSASQQMS